MKVFMLLVLMFCLIQQPSEAGVIAKVLHVTKSVVTLPLYVVGGALVGSSAGILFWIMTVER